jgi:hypothetical protein
MVGTMLGSGTFVLDSERNRRFARSVGGDPEADPTVNALWVLTSGMHELGTGLTELFARAGCDIAADGPMLGGCAMQVTRRLELDRPYRADGEVVGLERKTGRRTGPFDLLRVRTSLHDDAGEVAAATTTYILPRRGA